MQIRFATLEADSWKSLAEHINWDQLEKFQKILEEAGNIRTTIYFDPKTNKSLIYHAVSNKAFAIVKYLLQNTPVIFPNCPSYHHELHKYTIDEKIHIVLESFGVRDNTNKTAFDSTYIETLSKFNGRLLETQIFDYDRSLQLVEFNIAIEQDDLDKFLKFEITPALQDDYRALFGHNILTMILKVDAKKIRDTYTRMVPSEKFILNTPSEQCFNLIKHMQVSFKKSNKSKVISNLSIMSSLLEANPNMKADQILYNTYLLLYVLKTDFLTHQVSSRNLYNILRKIDDVRTSIDFIKKIEKQECSDTTIIIEIAHNLVKYKNVTLAIENLHNLPALIKNQVQTRQHKIISFYLKLLLEISVLINVKNVRYFIDHLESEQAYQELCDKAKALKNYYKNAFDNQEIKSNIDELVSKYPLIFNAASSSPNSAVKTLFELCAVKSHATHIGARICNPIGMLILCTSNTPVPAAIVPPFIFGTTTFTIVTSSFFSCVTAALYIGTAIYTLIPDPEIDLTIHNDYAISAQIMKHCSDARTELDEALDKIKLKTLDVKITSISELKYSGQVMEI